MQHARSFSEVERVHRCALRHAFHKARPRAVDCECVGMPLDNIYRHKRQSYYLGHKIAAVPYLHNDVRPL